MKKLLKLTRLLVFLMLANASAAGQPSARAEEKIPLCVGLTIVTAVNQPDGDYESIKRIVRMDGNGIGVRYSSERSVIDEFSGNDKPVLKRVNTLRNIRMTDQAAAPVYLVTFQNDMPGEVPQTTALGISEKIIQALKTGNASLGLIRDVMPNASLDKASISYIYNGRVDYKLRRDSAVAKIPVLVNGRPVMLPALRATGDAFGDKVEFFFLDDQKNPLALKFRLGIDAYAEVNRQMIAATGKPAHPGNDRDALRVVRISHDCAVRMPTQESGGGVAEAPSTTAKKNSLSGAAATMEQSLAKHETVNVYDIFFSFNNATLRQESEPTLKIIGELLQRHPDWRLRIGGHTDSIASDQFNLQLSAKRSEAVKSAIVEKFKIAPARLLTQGHGEARPRDTNTTLEGRARNRRVELQRL